MKEDFETKGKFGWMNYMEDIIGHSPVLYVKSMTA